MSRPTPEDIERFLDRLKLEQLTNKWMLEDLANIEDCPEMDLIIKRANRQEGRDDD